MIEQLLPRLLITWRIYIAPHPHREPDRLCGGQVDGDMGAIHGYRGAGAANRLQGGKLMLAKGAGLDNQFTRMGRARINQLYRRAFAIQRSNERAHIGGQPWALFNNVKVAQSYVQQATVIDNLGAAAG